MSTGVNVNRQMSYINVGSINIISFRWCTDSIRIQIFEIFGSKSYCCYLGKFYSIASYSDVKMIVIEKDEIGQVWYQVSA